MTRPYIIMTTIMLLHLRATYLSDQLRSMPVLVQSDHRHVHEMNGRGIITSSFCLLTDKQDPVC
jgi:hypothetical protein